MLFVLSQAWNKGKNSESPRGRASERGIRRSEVRFLVASQNFSLSHARDKTKNIFLYFFTELKTNQIAGK